MTTTVENKIEDILVTLTETKKNIPFISDLGILSGMDICHDLDRYLDSNEFEDRLKQYTEETVNTLMSEFLNLDQIEEEEYHYIILPEPKMKLPRTQRIPESKVKSKWQKFAEAKGIKKKKRSAMVYNEELGEYIPRYGSKSIKHDKRMNWIKEVEDTDKSK